jgi:hypothetical protein
MRLRSRVTAALAIGVILAPAAHAQLSEVQGPPLSDIQSWWTGIIVLSMLFGTTIWSFVKFGADESPFD